MMKMTIRNEREYWEARENAERLERAASWSSLSNAEKNHLAMINAAMEVFEVGRTRSANYVRIR